MHGTLVLKSKWLMSDEGDFIARFNKHLGLPTDKKLANYNNDPNLGLYLYAILIDQFGFEIFSTLHKNYDKLNVSPNTNQQKYDLLV